MYDVLESMQCCLNDEKQDLMAPILVQIFLNGLNERYYLNINKCEINSSLFAINV